MTDPTPQDVAPDDAPAAEAERPPPASSRRGASLAPVAVAAGLVLAGFLAFALLGGPADDDGRIVTARPSAPGQAPRASEGRRAPRDDVHAGVAAEGPTPADGGGALPPGHPAIHGAGAPPATPPAGMGGGAGEPDDGHPDLPLRAKGINSKEELGRGVARAASPESRAAFEQGFRLVFTTRKEARDYATGERLLARAVELDPKLAEAYRALGYARFNTGGGFGAAIPLYEKAIEVKPDYGEAHYALAFFLGETNPAKGRTHFARAMRLGVPDERGLRARYYPDVE